MKQTCREWVKSTSIKTMSLHANAFRISTQPSITWRYIQHFNDQVEIVIDDIWLIFTFYCGGLYSDHPYIPITTGWKFNVFFFVCLRMTLLEAVELSAIIWRHCIHNKAHSLVLSSLQYHYPEWHLYYPDGLSCVLSSFIGKGLIYYSVLPLYHGSMNRKWMKANNIFPLNRRHVLNIDIMSKVQMFTVLTIVIENLMYKVCIWASGIGA